MEVCRTHPMCAVCVVAAKAWHGQWAERRESYVAAVCMSRELKDDSWVLTRLENRIWRMR